METTLDLMCLTMTLKMWILFLQWSWQCASIWHIVFLFVFVGLCLSSLGTIYYLSSIVDLAKLFHLDVVWVDIHNLLQQGLFCSMWFCLQCAHVHRTKAGSTFLWISTQARTNTFLILFRTLWRSVPGPLDAIFSPSIIILGSGVMSLYFYPCLKVDVGLLLGGHVWLRRCSKTKNLSGWYLTALHRAILNIRSLKRRYI